MKWEPAASLLAVDAQHHPVVIEPTYYMDAWKGMSQAWGGKKVQFGSREQSFVSVQEGSILGSSFSLLPTEDDSFGQQLIT